MKFLNRVLCYFIVICNFEVYADDPAPARELLIQNNSNGAIKVDVYPVGCVFNGNKDYSLRTFNQYQGFQYVLGGSILNIPPSANDWFGFEHDGTGLPPGENAEVDLYGIISYGKYRMDIYLVHDQGIEFSTYCYVDFSDFDYPSSYSLADTYKLLLK